MTASNTVSTTNQVRQDYQYSATVDGLLKNVYLPMLNNTTFTDIYSCYLLIERSLLDGVDLDMNGWAQQAEILGKVVPRARRMYEVPISYYGRTYEEGKKIRWYHTAEVVGTMAAVRLTGRALGKIRRT